MAPADPDLTDPRAYRRLAAMIRSVGKGLGALSQSSMAKEAAAASYETGGASGKLTLTPAERVACPVTAAACVDLAAHVTWLQADGGVTFCPG